MDISCKKGAKGSMTKHDSILGRKAFMLRVPPVSKIFVMGQSNLSF
jgi:hypothetical protein